MRYYLAEKAREDLRRSIAFHESQRDGLGLEFMIEVGLAIGRVLEGPTRWPQEEPGIYRYRLDRFKTALLYEVPSPKVINIVAIFDLRRLPGSWRD